MLVALSLLLHVASAAVTIHNSSDCCCVNLPDRSAKNLVSSVEECVASCAAASACHAAVLLGGDRAGQQCDAKGHVPQGKKCCLHKGHFDTMHHAGGTQSTVIDMGTSSGPCPGPKPPPPSPGPTLGGRPTFHYTRLQGEMNDPNGLQWRRLENGSVEYHMFHQHADPSCHGFDNTGSHAWGHGSSPDLVRWTRMGNSGVCGSTSGGVTIVPGELAAHTGWKGAIIVSAPSMKAIGNMSVGLHLYTSSDEHLENWTRYQPPALSPNGDDCVICPHLVPNATHAGNIGDTYVFADPPWFKPLPAGSLKRTFYVLSGSNICGPSEHGGHWCGFGAGTPQSLLFSSEDLVTWRFKSVFWRGPFTGATGKPLSRTHGSLYTPDTFTLPDGRQVLIYLMQGTLWQIGKFDADHGTFTAAASVAGRVSAGHEQGLGSCGQSLTDHKGRRVQFGWQHISLGVTTGAQSLPRVITAAPADKGGGLLFTPLPELETLHNASAHVKKAFTVAAGQSVAHAGIDEATGLHHHMKINVTLSTSIASGFVVCVQCDSAHAGVEVSFSSNGNGSSSTVTVGLGRDRLQSVPQLLRVGGSSGSGSAGTGSALVSAEIFTDGLIVELFAAGGEVALSHTTSSVRASGIAYTASGGAGMPPVSVELELWHMVTSVF